MPQPLDFTHLTVAQARERVGEVVELGLRRSGVSLMIRQTTGKITVLDPSILDYIPDEVLAAALLPAWPDDEILNLLRQRAERAAPGSA